MSNSQFGKVLRISDEARCDSVNGWQSGSRIIGGTSQSTHTRQPLLWNVRILPAANVTTITVIRTVRLFVEFNQRRSDTPLHGPDRSAIAA